MSCFFFFFNKKSNRKQKLERRKEDRKEGRIEKEKGKDSSSPVQYGQCGFSVEGPWSGRFRVKADQSVEV